MDSLIIKKIIEVDWLKVTTEYDSDKDLIIFNYKRYNSELKIFNVEHNLELNCYEVQLNKNKWCLIDLDDYDILFYNLFRYQSNRNSTGYVYTGKNEKLHRLIMNPPKNKYIDHINGDGLDNRKSNLRVVSRAENGRNRKLNLNNKSGIKGVRLRKKAGRYYWSADINDLQGKTKEKIASIDKYGNDEAKQICIEWRKAKEIEYGYLNTH